LNSSMKFSAVKRQLLDDQVESAKSLLSYTTEIERKGELDFNPYLKSEMSHLQKYVDQLSIKPKSPFSMYRRTEEEDLSYCLHKNHSKSMGAITALMKNINKEMYRLKKLKQAEKKLEFLELFQSRDNNSLSEDIQHAMGNIQPAKQNQYKLPDSKSAFIPQLASPKPKYGPINCSFHDEEEEKPEMSRAMEGFLKQQEKERKEKLNNSQRQKETKPLAVFMPDLNAPERIEKETNKKDQQQQANKSGISSHTTILKENPLTTSGDSKAESTKEKKTTDSSSAQRNKPLTFGGLRQSGPTYVSPHSHPYTSSDPERPYGAYSNDAPYPHYISTFGRSSGTTIEGQAKSADEKSRGTYY